jgi:hypothetical protein
MRSAIVVLVSFLLAPMVAPSAAVAVRPPRLGNWEGHGSRGLSMSFTLKRHGRYIDVGRGGFTITTPTFQALCPAGSATAAAQHWDRAGYLGPASRPPLPIFHFRLREVSFGILGPGEFATFSGKLRNRRTMILKSPYTGHQAKGCGWPRSLRWVVHPKRRAPLTNGTWTGTTSGPDGITATVSAQVVGAGHIVDHFKADWQCDAGGGGSGIEAPMAEEFIHADGTFIGPLGGSFVDGLSQNWSGRFTGATLTGTIHTWNVCSGSGPLDIPFAAQRA